MVFKCSVFGCKGNYSSGQKVSIFRFPKDPKLRQIWCARIMRKHFTPTENSRICELHFHKEDILREEEYYDKKSQKFVKAPLSYPRVREGAVPKKLYQECPISTITANEESAPKRRKLMADDIMLRAPQEDGGETHQVPELKRVKEEVIEENEEEEPESILPTLSEDVNTLVNTRTNLSSPKQQTMVVLPDPPQSEVLKNRRLTLVPIISNVLPPQGPERNDEDDNEELDLYLKLFVRKLKTYCGLERRQIMHEIDGIFLRRPPSTSSCPTSTPQFLLASIDPTATSSFSSTR